MNDTQKPRTIRNPNAVGWRVSLTDVYWNIKNRIAFIYRRMANKLRLSKLHSKINSVLLLIIATALLFTTLFSISSIIVVGLGLFALSRFWQGFMQIFMSPIKQKP